MMRRTYDAIADNEQRREERKKANKLDKAAKEQRAKELEEKGRTGKGSFTLVGADAVEWLNTVTSD